MIPNTAYYGYVNEEFLDAIYESIDPVDESIAEALYDNADCIENSTRVDNASQHDIAQQLNCTAAANDMFCSKFYNF